MKEITNKPIPKQYENQYQQMFKEGEALFIVVGDLNLKGKYGDSMMVFTREKLVAFDECYEKGFLSVNFNKIEVADVKKALRKRCF